MEPNRLGYRRAEPAREPFLPEHLMAIIDPARRGAVAEIMDQVTYIVQQRGGNKRRLGTSLFGERGALQPMLELLDPVAAIVVSAMAVEALENLIDRVHRKPLGLGDAFAGTPDLSRHGQIIADVDAHEIGALIRRDLAAIAKTDDPCRIKRYFGYR